MTIIAPARADVFSVSNFKPYKKNTLLAFLSLTLPSGLTLHGCTLHQKGESRWVSMPAKSYVKNDGETAWAIMVEIPDKDTLREFQALAIEAIDAYLAGGSK